MVYGARPAVRSRSGVIVGAVLLAAGLLLSTPALADDGVSGEQIVAADAETVRRLLADPSTTLSLNQDILDYRIEDAPPCQLVHVTTKGVTAPLKYTVRRCPTETGFRETLVGGDEGVQAMDVEWTTEPHGSGTRVHLSIFASIAKVPQFLVNQRTRQSIAHTLRSLGRKADTQAR